MFGSWSKLLTYCSASGLRQKCPAYSVYRGHVCGRLKNDTYKREGDVLVQRAFCARGNQVEAHQCCC